MTAWTLQPSRFNLYEDLSGRQYVLLQETGVRNLWLALRLNDSPALTMLSRSNLTHLILIGRASFDETQSQTPNAIARGPQSCQGARAA